MRVSSQSGEGNSPYPLRPRGVPYKFIIIIIIIIIIISITTYRATARAVSRRPLTAKARIRHQANQCGICDGKIWH